MTGTVSGLFIYPIKGCHGVAAESAVVERRGLRHDRRWMLVHAETGVFLSQRSHPEMARIGVAVTPEGTLTGTWEGTTHTVSWEPDDALKRCTVSVWSFTGEALDVGDAAAAFFSEALHLPVRLARVPEDFARRVNPDYARTPGDGTGFADGYPVLVTTEPSLADLNERMAQPLPMNRFRPNVVLTGDFAPWAEHGWASLHVAGATLFAVKPCDRCAVTTIEQETGERTGPEPLATLATFRRDPTTGKVYFGVNLIPAMESAGETVRIGDSVALG